MPYQGYSPRPDGQQKAMKYCLTKHSMDLYRTGKEWSTFDFDQWLRTHWE